ncbi:RICIN domain-containing protein [Embleya sp. NPDC020886]|uniref:RICIN domain-containing protein n=1 Tax=Embleya sp. NPDC020886 TaxID=3363980 RepID=UPI003791C411
MSDPNDTGAHVGSSAPSLAQVYARRPARPRRGLLPGRRVWVSLGSAAGIAAVTTLAVAVAPNGSGGNAAAGRTVAAAAGAPGGASTGGPGVVGVPGVTGSPGSSASPTAASPTGGGATPPSGGAPEVPAGPETPGAAGPGAPAAARPPAAEQPATKPDAPRQVPAAQPTTARPKAAAPPAAPPAPPPNVPGNPLRNPSTGKCLSGSAGSDGTPLVLWSCNGNANQKWDIRSDGTIRTKGLCMDAAWGSTAKGTVVQLAYCSGNPAQQFVLVGTYIFTKNAGMCADIWDFKSNDGAAIRLHPCHYGANQVWQRG